MNLAKLTPQYQQKQDEMDAAEGSDFDSSLSPLFAEQQMISLWSCELDSRKIAIALNNAGVVLLEKECYKQASVALRYSYALWRVAERCESHEEPVAVKAKAEAVLLTAAAHQKFQVGHENVKLDDAMIDGSRTAKVRVEAFASAALASTRDCCFSRQLNQLQNMILRRSSSRQKSPDQEKNSAVTVHPISIDLYESEDLDETLSNRDFHMDYCAAVLLYNLGVLFCFLSISHPNEKAQRRRQKASKLFHLAYAALDNQSKSIPNILMQVDGDDTVVARQWELIQFRQLQSAGIILCALASLHLTQFTEQGVDDGTSDEPANDTVLAALERLHQIKNTIQILDRFGPGTLKLFHSNLAPAA